MNRISSFSRYFLVLAIMAAGLFFFQDDSSCGQLSNPNCGNANTTNSPETGRSLVTPEVQSVSLVTANPQAFAPGATVNMKLQGTWDSGTATFTWTPPDGATHFFFVDKQPEPGGPPFVFNGITQAEGSTGITVGYDAPSIQASAKTFAEILKIDLPSGDSDDAFALHAFKTGKLEPAGAPQQSVPIQSPASPPESSKDAVQMWHYSRFVDVYDTAMTTSVCQQYVQWSQSADMFVAMRLPVADAALQNDTSYTLPVTQAGAAHSLNFTLQDYAFQGTSLVMPGVVRSDATLWANQHLPAAAKMLWTAVGVDPQAVITCPAGFDMDASSWGLILDMWLDLHERPNACEGCILTSYACYRPAAKTDWLTHLFAGRSALPSGDNGLACFGPDEVPLVSSGNWTLEAFTLTQHADPGDGLDLHYWISNHTGSAATFNLTIASTLSGTSWSLYKAQSGNYDLPDLSKPINGGQVIVAADNMFHIHAQATVPAGASGQYVFSMTAANAGMIPPSWKGTTTLLIGNLEPPAPQGGLFLYLPQVGKNAH